MFESQSGALEKQSGLQKLSEEMITRTHISGDIDEINNWETSAIIMASDGSIPMSENKMDRKLVEECLQTR